jgi:hypothetical protein
MVSEAIIASMIVGLLAGWISGFIIYLSDHILKRLHKTYAFDEGWNILLFSLISSASLVIYLSVIITLLD